jgi:hypothetical protein
MFHVSNVPRAHTSPLRGGIKTYIMRRFELESWLRNVERFQITEAMMVNLVPPLLVFPSIPFHSQQFRTHPW